jgi:hypothetical protein
MRPARGGPRSAGAGDDDGRVGIEVKLTEIERIDAADAIDGPPRVIEWGTAIAVRASCVVAEVQSKGNERFMYAKAAGRQPCLAPQHRSRQMIGKP